MKIIHMPPSYEPQVRALYHECHPGWPSLPEPHFFAHSTLIAVEDERLAGYTSFHMNISDAGVFHMMNKDVGVAEWARGRGVGAALNRRRWEIAEAMGAKYVIGATQPDNAPMLKIFHAQGFEKLVTVPRAYPDGRDAVAFILRLSAK